MIHIRKALISDIEGLIDVNIKTWQTAYKGIIKAETLNGLTKNREARIDRCKQEFGEREVEGKIIQQAVALEEDRVVGFATFGKCRESSEERLENASEIYAIYVLEDYQGKSIGKKLVHHAVKQLQKTGEFDKLVIWTLKDNPSRGFYERLGGVQKFEKIIEIAGQTLDEVGYVYDNLVELESKTK